MYATAERNQPQAIDPLLSSGYVPDLVPTPPLRRRTVTRRPSVEQGRALETLGHAIEYLVDSRLYLVDQLATRADAEATQLLMQHSRQVFAECAEVVPVTRRLKRWIAERLTHPADC